MKVCTAVTLFGIVTDMQNALIPLGSRVKDPGGHRWRVGAVTNRGGERYYMLTDGDTAATTVLLMPARDVEQWPRKSA